MCVRERVCEKGRKKREIKLKMSFYFASEEIASQKKVAIFFFYYVFDSQGFSALEEVIE